MDKKNLLKLIIGLSIISYLIYIIEVNVILETIKKIDKIYLIPVVVSVLLSNLLGTHGLYFLTKPINKSIEEKELLSPYFVSWSLGQLLPSKIGEFSRIYFLKKRGLNMRESTLIFLLDKINSIICLIIITIIGIHIFTKIDTSMYIISLTIILMCILVIIINEKIRNKIFNLIPKKFYDKLLKDFSEDSSNYLKENRKYIIYNLIINALRLLIDAVTIWLLFKSLNLTPNIWYILIVNTITTLSTIIPITISGLGIREVVAVFLLSTVGIQKEISFIVYITIATIRLLISLIVVSLYTSKEGLNIFKEKIN